MIIYFRQEQVKDQFRLVLIVDDKVDINDISQVAWQMMGNSDARRDVNYISENSLIIDGTVKLFHRDGFPRRWPNIVCSDIITIDVIDKKWESLGIGDFIHSPSRKHSLMSYSGKDEIEITNR
jgi:4-hydroxy-3-polyprenylbenzoate decarboxylase